MKLVQYRDDVLEVRWTWLPYWLAVNPKLKNDVDRELRDIVLINGMTNSEEDLLALHAYVATKLANLFPSFEGLGPYLDNLKTVNLKTGES